MANGIKTIRDIAEIAGVSQSTVSKALNDRPDIGAKTRDRILQIASEQGFTPSIFGKGLKQRNTENVGVIFIRESQPLSGNPFYSRVLEGIEAELALNNYNLVLHLLPENGIDQPPKMIRDHYIDGVILVGVIRQAYIEKLQSYGIPIILVDPKREFPDHSQVLIDNEQGAYTATAHLIRKGHTRIGFISGELDRQSFKLRYDGYIKALRGAGIPFNKTLVRSFGLEQGYDHVKELMKLRQPPTAIFAANDINALNGYRACQDLGLRIPEDVSIIGFDDIDLGRFAAPALSTIRVYKEELGSMAVRLMLKQIPDSSVKPVTVMIPTRLVERESVTEFINA